MSEVVERINVASETSSRNYVVCRYDDGTYSCSCPSWIFSKGHKKECKHIVYAQRKKTETTITIDGLKKEAEAEMKPNQEGDSCAKCFEGIGEVPISDNEHGQYWICEKCDSEMFDNSLESKGIDDIDENKEARADLMIKYDEVELD